MGNKWRRRPTWQEVSAVLKAVSPPIVAVALLTIVILITPVAAAIGRNAFLVLTYLHLFFYPHGPFGDHVEKVFLHLTMCALGQAISTLVVCATIWIQGDSGRPEYTIDGSKALGACALVILCLLGGLCQSLYPRIKMAVRILLFSSTWTICTGAVSIESAIFTNQFYPAALAAAASLLVALTMFPQSAQDDFALLLVKVFSIQRAILNQAFRDFFDESALRKPSSQLTSLRGELLDLTSALKEGFESAQLELNYGRLAVVEAKPLVAIATHTKGWLHCGMGLGTREGGQPASEKAELSDRPPSAPAAQAENKMEIGSLQPCISKLLDQITLSIFIVESCIELTMRGGSPRTVVEDDRWNVLYKGSGREKAKQPGLTVLRQRKELTGAIETFKGDLASVLKRLAVSASTEMLTSDVARDENTAVHFDLPASSGMFRSDVYDVAFLMVSLMEIAKELAGALMTCQALLASWHAHDRKRVWFPSVTMSSWLKRKRSDEGGSSLNFEHDKLELGRRETFLVRDQERLEQDREEHGHRHAWWKGWSHRASVIRWRIRVSHAIKSVKQSIHIRYALKLAGGVALLSLPSWLSDARRWFQDERGVWLIVTYIWVLETSTGATVQVSLYRAAGTIAGALWALLAWYIGNEGNRYAVGVFIILAEVPACYFIIYTKHAQSLGLVFALTQSVILFVPLMPVIDSPVRSVVHIALVRGYQILLGVAAAFLVNIFIWPLHARVYLIRTVSHITWQCSTLYLSLARQMLNHGVTIAPETKRKFDKLEDSIQAALTASRTYLDMTHIELSLIPKPTHTLSLLIKTLQRIADLLLLLRKCREVALGIIQKEACFNVLNLRKELVSSILLSFWVIGQSLRTKERLPQFLPSCRSALEDLTEAMREQIDTDLLQVQLPNSSADTSKHQSSGPTSARAPLSASRRRLYTRSGTSTPHSSRQPRVIDYSYFFVFAEHTLLSEIIFEVEKLLFLTRLLVGESSFIDSDYLPNDFAYQYDHFDPRFVDTLDLDAFQHSMSEHGIDGRRLAAQLESQLRAGVPTPTAGRTPMTTPPTRD